MPKKNAAEFTWIESLQVYRKRIKNPNTGKWESVYGKTKQIVRQKIEQRKLEIAEETQRTEDPLVWQYAATWYQLNTVGLSESRKDDYKNAINNHICPIIGNMRVRDVKPDDIKLVMAACADMSKSSQQKITTTLRRIFEAAEDNDLIGKSPCRKLRAGGPKPKEKIPLTKAQSETLIEAVRGTRAELFVLIGLYAGLRREEICALQWDCVDLDAETPFLSVRRAVHWQKNNVPIVSDELKSDAAARDIPLAPRLMEALKAAKVVSTSAFVVPDTEGGVMSGGSFKRLWGIVESRSTGVIERKVKQKDGSVKVYKREKKLGDKVARHDLYITIDFPVTPHQLRHTFITNLILSGANLKVVQYLAGHATSQMTLDIYGHLMENRPADTHGVIEGAFGAPTPSPEGQPANPAANPRASD